jgi:streptogramin lyase
MPATLALDRNGLIWFTDQNQNSPSIWSFNVTSRVFQRLSTHSSPSDPIFVLVDPTTNNVWFTDYYGNYIGEIISSTHIMNRFTLPIANSYPVEIAKQNGTSYLWITEETGNIARFDMNTDTFQQFTPSLPLVYPVGIVADKTGNVWVSEHGGSSVAEFIPSNSTWRKYPTSQAMSSPGTGVATLTMDSQGRLWFAEHYSNRIGRLDPATSVMDEFSLPVPGAYSLLDTVDARGNFWFTEATSNEIGMIPGNATVPVTAQLLGASSLSVTAGHSTSAVFVVTNHNSSTITLNLNVTSFFTTNYYTTRSEVSLSIYKLTLGPDQSSDVNATVTPDISLGSGVYTAGVVATLGNVSSIGTFFLRVDSNLLYQFETLLPWILLASAAIIAVTFLVIRRRKSSSISNASKPSPRVAPVAAVLALFVVLVQGTGQAWGKCPGLPAPPGGPDPYGIALDIGSIAFFAVIAYFLIRSRLKAQSPT